MRFSQVKQERKLLKKSKEVRETPILLQAPRNTIWKYSHHLWAAEKMSQGRRQNSGKSRKWSKSSETSKILGSLLIAYINSRDGGELENWVRKRISVRRRDKTWLGRRVDLYFGYWLQGLEDINQLAPLWGVGIGLLVRPDSDGRVMALPELQTPHADRPALSFFRCPMLLPATCCWDSSLLHKPTKPICLCAITYLGSLMCPVVSSPEVSKLCPSSETIF